MRQESRATIRRSPISRVSRKAKAERRAGPLKVYLDGREVCLRNPAGVAEYKRRTAEMAERQGNRCAVCSFSFDGYLGQPTFEHQDGRTAGHRDDRIERNGEWYNAALHGICNGLKGSRRFHWVGGKFIPAVYATVADWIGEER